MRNNTLRLAVALLLIVSLLCVPVFAANDHGAFYDETEMLSSDELTKLGENTLPMLSEQMGIELRIDVLTMISSDTVKEAAEAIYDQYDYGFGEDMRAVTLTILMERSGSTYAMQPGNWCVYVGGSDERMTDGTLLAAVTAAIEPYMTDSAWNGDDMSMSAAALAQAGEALFSSVADFVLGGGTDIDAPVYTNLTEDPAVDGENPTMEYVMDFAYILSDEEWRTLEERAAEISAKYGCGVYAAALDDYTAYGSSIESVIEDTYHQLELGEGSERNGIILLLSMNDRDFATFVYGDKAEYAFDAYGLKQLDEVFLDNFADDDWYGGFSDYIDKCGEYLALAESGDPVRENPLGGVVIAVLLAIVIAFVVCMILKRKMKSVSKKAEANVYVTAAGLSLSQQRDVYTYTTQSRTKVKSQSSDSFSGSGGGHGHSGKF